MSPPKQYHFQKTPLCEITLENICDSETTRPISYWPPRREEIQRFIEIAKAVHTEKSKPRILDVGCGTGFLAYLLAQTGEVNVTAIDPDASLFKDSPYTHPNVRFEIGDCKNAVEQYQHQNIDIVINSWMPYQVNLTPDIRNIGAKVIIYVKERSATGVPYYEPDHPNFDNPNPVTLANDISYHPGENYIPIFAWCGPTYNEIKIILREVKKQKTLMYLVQALERSDPMGIDTNRNEIDIQFRKDIPPLEIPSITIPNSQKYRWETELEKIKGPVDKMKKYG